LQTLFVIVCCCAGLFWALQLTAPRARSASRPLGQQQQLRCFPLDDKDKVKLLGPQNDLAALPIGTASAGAQTLFNLGLLQLYGFNQHEATIMFQVGPHYPGDTAASTSYHSARQAAQIMNQGAPRGKLRHPQKLQRDVRWCSRGS
jgi:hypothetical protein